MPVYIVTGKLGGGKTIVSVQKILEKLQKKRVVATNLDLNLHKLISPFDKKCRVIRIPDKPTIHDLESIGKGTESYNENLNGLLVLDECGTWFNSRNWQDKNRTPVNEWFLHARKLGWDVILIIQDISNLDSQARSSIAEHTEFCRRTDRVGIPILSTLFRWLSGMRLKLPKAHLARVVYGVSESDLTVDRWTVMGTSLYQAYDTKQAFIDSYPHGAHSLLPPWHTHGRYMAARNMGFVMRMTKIYFKKFNVPIVATSGLLFGTAIALAFIVAMNYDPNHDHQKYEAPQPAVKKVIKEALFVIDPIIAMLENSSIVGSWITGDTSGYSIRYAKNEMASDILRTTDLEHMGYQVDPVSNCSTVISRDGQFVPVFCY